MHLHSMTIQALGPFAGTHTIDFAELGASGLFLLEGPTGAGKSTIIDAIVFALYGKVASEEASEDRLRSDHARPEQETFVDLVLEAGSGVYRVRRTPRFDRPKQRGSGTTTQQATVKLWRLAGVDAPDDGELLSTRLDEAGAELQRIVGLDRAQLVQTIVLPQGEFASFLRANPEDRRGLLQKVFGTAVYEQLQQQLERLRAEAGRSLDAARQGLTRAGARLVGAIALPDDDAAAVLAASQAASGAAGPAEILGLARAHVCALGAEAEEAASGAAVARAACAASQERLDAARAAAAAVVRRTALEQELDALLGAADERRQQAERLVAARRAQSVLPLVAGREQAVEAVVRAERRVDGALAAAPADLHDVVTVFSDVQVQRKTLMVERDRCTALRATLDRLAELEGAMPARLARLAAEESALAGRLTERSLLLAKQQEDPVRLRAIAAELAAVTRTAAGLASAQEGVAVAEGRLAAAEEVARLTLEVTAAEQAVVAAAADAGGSVERVALAQQARIAGIAGELAMQLVPGRPCAVCGGVEHPAPATTGPGHVTVGDVEAAEIDRQAATTALIDASERLTGLRIALEGRRTVAAVDRDTAERELAVALHGVSAARAAVREQGRLESELTAADAAVRRLDEQVAALGERCAADEARLTELRAQAVRDQAEIDVGRDDASSVRERVRALTVRIDLVGAWVEALSDAEEARAQEAVRAAELAAGLAEHEFADGAAVREVSLPAAEIASLARVLSQYESSIDRVTAGLAEPEIAALPEHLDVPGAAAQVAELRSVHEEADRLASGFTGRAAALQQRAGAGTSALAELEQAAETCQTLEAQAGPVVRMANVAGASGGDNAAQLTLATYVLARRFEDVVAAANARLVTISDGRYALAHSSSREDVRARKRGLAMKVMDHRTGVERDPRTLSGGETFYVSLCLALGLADVVTAEAGGIDLGTLFVDEGFGSLDPETLEVVLAELGRLRDGGRVVGVVSHVEALKQSIAERIEVRRVPGGSSTLTVRA